MSRGLSRPTIFLLRMFLLLRFFLLTVIRTKTDIFHRIGYSVRSSVFKFFSRHSVFILLENRKEKNTKTRTGVEIKKIKHEEVR